MLGGVASVGVAGLRQTVAMLRVPCVRGHHGWAELLLSVLTELAVPAAVHHATHPDVVPHLHLGHLPPHPGDDPGQLVTRNAGVAREP